MRLVRFVAVLLLAASLPAGCGRKPRTRGHGAQEPSPAALAPTPDTTPVAALRTPAGLILKAGPEPTGTPAPGGATPAAAPGR